MVLGAIGAGCFGLVIGWITYRTLRRGPERTSLQDIATVVSAVGGGAVVSLFSSEALFGAYSIGLAVGFFGYLGVAWKDGVENWMGD